MKGLLKIELGIAEIPQVFMRRAMLDSVNFGCFDRSRCQCFHCNAMRKAIKAHKNWLTIQQNEHTPD